MSDLQERLRQFADEGARQARPPGVEAALRRGRRRQQRLVGAVGLVLMAGGLLFVVWGALISWLKG